MPTFILRRVLRKKGFLLLSPSHPERPKSECSVVSLEKVLIENLFRALLDIDFRHSSYRISPRLVSDENWKFSVRTKLLFFCLSCSEIRNAVRFIMACLRGIHEILINILVVVDGPSKRKSDSKDWTILCNYFRPATVDLTTSSKHSPRKLLDQLCAKSCFHSQRDQKVEF